MISRRIIEAVFLLTFKKHGKTLWPLLLQPGLVSRHRRASAIMILALFRARVVLRLAHCVSAPADGAGHRKVRRSMAVDQPASSVTFPYPRR